MVVPNRLVQAPQCTPVRRFADDEIGYDFEVWASYFPSTGVEYHVKVNRIEKFCTIKINIYCNLSGRIGRTVFSKMKSNRSTTAQAIISSKGIVFQGVPTLNAYSCFASCGLEQISMITDAILRVEAFDERCENLFDRQNQ